MNLQQLYEILIANDNTLKLFESEINTENYRQYFFSLFHPLNKEFIYEHRQTNETFTAHFKDFPEKRQKLILIQIWNDKQKEIREKQYNKGLIRFGTLLTKRGIKVEGIYEELLGIYFNELTRGKNIGDAREETYEEIERKITINEINEEEKEETYTILNELITKINESLANAKIDF